MNKLQIIFNLISSKRNNKKFGWKSTYPSPVYQPININFYFKKKISISMNELQITFNERS